MTEEFHIVIPEPDKYRVAVVVGQKQVELGPFLDMEKAIIIQEWLKDGGAQDIWELLGMPEGGLAIIMEQKAQLAAMRVRAEAAGLKLDEPEPES